MKSETLRITSTSLEQTLAIGELTGRLLDSPGLILLTGELGCGKTSFVQGLGKGLDVLKNYYITSPSYTLVNEYPGRIPIYHVDLYRLSGPEDFESAGIYHILSEESHVVVMEWANLMEEVSLMDPMTVTFSITGPDERIMDLAFSGARWEPLKRQIIKEMRMNKWL